MLTIAIPTYNFNILPLVERLLYLCNNSKIVFEIICYDDGSSDKDSLIENKKINQLKHCTFYFNNINKGASFSRNWLIEKSNFENILLIDDDMMPEKDCYVNNYLPYLNSNYEIIYGGLYYKKNFDKSKMLRYIYGKKREALNVKQRYNKKYVITMFNNTLFNKGLIKKIKFDESISKYGYEDLFFMLSAEKLNINVKHIENSIAHLNDDTSKEFVEKFKNSINNLIKLYFENKISKYDSPILYYYFLMKKYHLIFIFKNIYKIIEPKIHLNLISKNPNILFFDIFKLGYLTIQIEKK